MFSFLKEILWDIPIDMMRDGFIGAILGLIFLVCMWVLAFMLCYGAFYLADTVGMEPYASPAQVVSKNFTPEHTTFVMVGKVLTPIPVDDSWDITVKLPEHITVNCSATHAQYDRLHAGDNTNARLRSGRISSSIYCDNII